MGRAFGSHRTTDPRGLPQHVVNNDVYNGPVDTVGPDGDLRLNEDHVDGKDDDADGLVDEDWLGGNSEPETKFIQDMTEMNDDNNDGASDFKATLTWHSFSELVLYRGGTAQLRVPRS